MTTIHIHSDSRRVTQAITWCMTQFGNEFCYNNQFPSSRWSFTFPTAANATLFTLKWAH